MKKLISLLILLLILLQLAACEKPKEEIELNLQNYKSYISVRTLGKANDFFTECRYTEVDDDYGDYYWSGDVCTHLNVPLSVTSLTDKYTCEGCKVKVHLGGNMYNAYEYSELNSSHRIKQSINQDVYLHLNKDFGIDKVVAKDAANIYVSYDGGNYDYAPACYDIAFFELTTTVESVKGKLIEK